MILKQQQKIIHLCTALRYELEDTKATRATEKLTQQVIEYLGALTKQMENEPFIQENGNKNNDNVNSPSRVDMLFDLLNDTNSIMMLTKDADGTLTYCYDCKSEEDFDDLISMEVK